MPCRAANGARLCRVFITRADQRGNHHDHKDPNRAAHWQDTHDGQHREEAPRGDDRIDIRLSIPGKAGNEIVITAVPMIRPRSSCSLEPGRPATRLRSAPCRKRRRWCFPPASRLHRGRSRQDRRGTLARRGSTSACRALRSTWPRRSCTRHTMSALTRRPFTATLTSPRPSSWRRPSQRDALRGRLAFFVDRRSCLCADSDRPTFNSGEVHEKAVLNFGAASMSAVAAALVFASPAKADDDPSHRLGDHPAIVVQRLTRPRATTTSRSSIRTPLGCACSEPRVTRRAGRRRAWRGQGAIC